MRLGKRTAKVSIDIEAWQQATTLSVLTNYQNGLLAGIVFLEDFDENMGTKIGA